MLQKQYASTVSGFVFATALFCLAATGCGESGPKLVPVAGKVLIDGEPVQYGYIRFVPSGGRPSDSRIEADGTFRLKYNAQREGVVLGTHRVEVAGNKILSPTRVMWYAPKRYASIGTSGLTEEITAPMEDLVIELEWDNKKGPYEETFIDDGGT